MKRKKSREAPRAENTSHKVRIMIISHGKGLSLWVEGAERLLLCLSHSIRILLKNEILCLCGKGLLCTTYASGAIEVTGALEEIRFEPSRAAKSDEGV